MNHGDTDDTEIVSGDEDDLPLIHDISVQANDDSEVTPAVEPVVVEQSDAVINESEWVEPQPEADTNLDWLPSVAQEPAVLVETVSEQSDVPAIESEVVESEPQAESSFDEQPSVAQEPLVLMETVSESVESAKVQPQRTGWQRARSFFFGSSADTVARMNNLMQAIEDAPDSAVNYVLRAEVYMELREYALAQADYQRAIELAQVQFELADWGFLDQAMRDRALTGLEKVQRRLR